MSEAFEKQEYPIPDGEKWESDEEAEGSTELGHEGLQRVDVGLLFDSHRVGRVSEHEPNTFCIIV